MQARSLSRWFINVYRLGLKEMMALMRDPVLLGLMIFSFTFSIYSVANGVQTEVHNAAIAVVDGDGSQLSRRIISALQPPYFLSPQLIDRRRWTMGLTVGFSPSSSICRRASRPTLTQAAIRRSGWRSMRQP